MASMIFLSLRFFVVSFGTVFSGVGTVSSGVGTVLSDVGTTFSDVDTNVSATADSALVELVS